MKRISALAAVLSSTLVPTSAIAAQNGYPTVDRVEYVITCMNDTPGPRHEIMYKCSCAIDAIAKSISHEEFIEKTTISNALSIGGERGEVMRGFVGGRKTARSFRKVQAEARKACFLP